MMLKGFELLKQADYGEELDCSLTSITACILYYMRKKKPNCSITPQNIYNYVERIAKNYWYNGTTFGVFGGFIKYIYSMCLGYFLNTKINVTMRVIKGLGYNFNTIINQIDQEHPVLLALSKASIYKNHTVAAIGYNKDKQQLYIADNWVDHPVILNYSDIGLITTINYVTQEV